MTLSRQVITPPPERNEYTGIVLIICALVVAACLLVDRLSPEHTDIHEQLQRLERDLAKWEGL